MDDDNTKCKCVFFGGSCIDDDCVNYRAGRECSLATCTNPACKNRCIQDNSFPEHTIFTTNETSDEFYMIADCDIDKGQSIAPVYGNAVSLQSIYKYIKESKKRDVKYLVISILPAVAVEFTNCGNCWICERKLFSHRVLQKSCIVKWREGANVDGYCYCTYQSWRGNYYIRWDLDLGLALILNYFLQPKQVPCVLALAENLSARVQCQ